MLKGPSQGEVQRLGDEIVVHGQVRVNIMLAALTTYSVFLGWMITALPSGPANGLYLFTLAQAILFALFLVQHEERLTIHRIATYLRATESSGWEMDLAQANLDLDTHAYVALQGSGRSSLMLSSYTDCMWLLLFFSATFLPYLLLGRFEFQTDSCVHVSVGTASLAGWAYTTYFVRPRAIQAYEKRWELHKSGRAS